MEEIDIAAGAVIYQICFPSNADLSRNSVDFGAAPMEASAKPEGGSYGGGFSRTTDMEAEFFGCDLRG
jgi:hypothetical protein